MYYHVTNYGAVWATSKENNVIDPVNGTVFHNTLPGVIRFSCVVEPIFCRYHQTMYFERSYSVPSSSKSLNCFPCRSDISWGKNAKSNCERSSEYGHVVFYRISSYLPLQVLLEEYLMSSVYLTVLLYMCCLFNMNLDVSTSVIFADMQNLMALRMSFDGVTSLIFRISYHDRCAISDILII